MTLALALLLAVRCAASAPSPVFDGAPGRARPDVELAAPRLGPSAVMPERASPAGAPADLAAARARFGNETMIARLPDRPAGEAFSFGVIGDAEPGRFWWERLYSPGKGVFERQWTALEARGPDFVLQLGDFVSEGTVGNYRAHLALLDRDLTLPLLRCVGNHDRSRPNGDADKTLYDAVFGPRDYFFDHGGWRFISLDSSDRALTPAQLSWLRGALSAPGPKVIYTHVPPAYLKKAPPLAEVGPLVAEGDSQEKDFEAQGGYLHDFLTNYFEDGADGFEALVSSRPYGVRAVFMGHIHAFWAGDWKGVRYVISGGGGSPLYPLPPGYPKQRFAHTLWVTAFPDGRLDIDVEPLKGAGFTLAAPASARPAASSTGR